jgi:hypothetical protein
VPDVFHGAVASSLGLALQGKRRMRSGLADTRAGGSGCDGKERRQFRCRVLWAKGRRFTSAPAVGRHQQLNSGRKIRIDNWKADV